MVTADLDGAIEPIQDKTATARADSVGKITTYETKYRPVADKYNSWCAECPRLSGTFQAAVASCPVASRMYRTCEWTGFRRTVTVSARTGRVSST